MKMLVRLTFGPSQLMAFVNCIMCRNKTQQYALVVDYDKKYIIIFYKIFLNFYTDKLQK
jgi:hypothetical protein